MYFVKKYDPESNVPGAKDDKHLIESGELGSWCKFTLIILIALSISNVNGFVNGYLLYGPTYYQYLPIGITATKAAQILSLMSLLFTIGRFVAVFETQIMSTELMITIHSIIALFSQILLYFGQNSETLIWIANALFGN